MFITNEIQKSFTRSLCELERSDRTVEKYTRDVRRFAEYVGSDELTKALTVRFKESLRKEMSPVSANSILAAVNCFLKFLGLSEFCVKAFKIQRRLFSLKNELSDNEYRRLVGAAFEEKNERLALIIQAICSTGIRVSELKFITVEAVKTGRAEVSCKGKFRVIFLPEKLRKILVSYIEKEKITCGAVFVTRSGKPVDRSNIWRDMKKLCEAAKVDPEKVFPHNLRHLFARTFYSLEKDISRLSDVLGHSNISTTRIYTMESGENHARQVNLLDLVVCLPYKNVVYNTTPIVL